MHNEGSYISKILNSGAAGYLLKTAGKSELIDAIKKVNDGENYFSKEVSRVMMDKYMKKSTNQKPISSLASVDDLTKREVEILAHITDEMTNNQIGEKIIHFSPHSRHTSQEPSPKNWSKEHRRVGQVRYTARGLHLIADKYNCRNSSLSRQVRKGRFLLFDRT